MKTLIQKFAIVSALLASLSVWGGTETETDDNDVILAGHDAVAYFTEGKPTVGSERYTAQHNSAVYRFASAENRDLFRANPDKFAPAYGGYCALGTSFGKKFEVDGKAFQVVEGRLYVNKNLKVYETWRKDIPNNVVKSEGRWPAIKDVPAGQL